GSRLSTEKPMATVISVNVPVREPIPSTTKDAKFQTRASAAARMDLVLPRNRREARSSINRYKKMPKINTPAECPSVLTSRDSFTDLIVRIVARGIAAVLPGRAAGVDTMGSGFRLGPADQYFQGRTP